MGDEKEVKKENKPKTMRNANIRISKVNNTKNEGQVIYELKDIKNIIDSWNSEKEFEYFLIEHNENLDNIHYHIVLKFNSVTRFDTIKNKFPYGNIENSKSLKNSIQYLIHMNSPEKFQYSPADIITNSQDLNKYLIRSKTSEELDIKEIIEKIENGEIREYEYTSKISVDLYTKYSTRIDKAFKYYYDKKVNEHNRQIDVEFYFGAGGTGKTLFAKTVCDIYNESYCISSSSNDVMQDYKGQDVLILDDLRDSTFKFEDFIKLLDNHTKSSTQSRYRNKVFIGKRIIITSNIELHQWYKWQKAEDIHQLHRRIPIMLKFSREKITTYAYSELNMKYFKVSEKDNDILLLNDEKEEEKEINRRLSRYSFM